MSSKTSQVGEHDELVPDFLDDPIDSLWRNLPWGLATQDRRQPQN